MPNKRPQRYTAAVLTADDEEVLKGFMKNVIGDHYAEIK
jgi:hypothetical protein